MTHVRHPPILATDFGAALAEIIAAWSGISRLLSMLLSDLMANRTLGPGDDMAAGLALMGMDARVQFGLVKTLGVARLGKRSEKRINALVDRLETLKKQRDFLAHACWHVNEKGKLVGNSLKTVGKVQYVERPIATADLQADFVKLTAAVSDLIRFFQSHGYLRGLQEQHGRFF